jgi:hypothetical protein
MSPMSVGSSGCGGIDRHSSVVGKAIADLLIDDKTKQEYQKPLKDRS